MTDYSQYQHPLTDRYTDPTLSHVFSEENKRQAWRLVWVALASAQAPDLVSETELEQIRSRLDAISVEESLRIERRTKHDVAAELELFREQVGGEAGTKIHLGATSSDITENTQTMLLKQATRILLGYTLGLYGRIVAMADDRAWDVVCLGRTHLQPAELTTWSARLLYYGYELHGIGRSIRSIEHDLHTKGFKGAVGNRATYAALYRDKRRDHYRSWEEAHLMAVAMDRDACMKLGLVSSSFSMQTPQRHDEYMLLASLTSLAAWLHKLNQDIRLSCGLGELAASREEGYVGSTAMPWKNNPIESEKVCSMTRDVQASLSTLWHNRALSMLERSLDDSANIRSLWPDVFISLAHCVRTTGLVLGRLSPTDAAVALRDMPPVSQSLQRVGIVDHEEDAFSQAMALAAAASFSLAAVALPKAF